MTNEPTENEQKIKRLKKIVMFVVLPLLVLGAVITGISGMEEPKPSATQILSEIEIQCYNVNWFGVHGFQITYTPMIENIANKMDKYDMDFSGEGFFKDQEVIDYMVIHCPHIDSTLSAPEHYDPNYGVQAVDKCLQVKEGIFDSEEYCIQFKP